MILCPVCLESLVMLLGPVVGLLAYVWHRLKMWRSDTHAHESAGHCEDGPGGG